MKEYKVPRDLQAIFTEYSNFCELRDKYVQLRYFGYGLALRATRDARKKRDEFWNKIYELYPELQGKNLTYNVDTGIVFLT
jgi:hypothetical protein